MPDFYWLQTIGLKTSKSPQFQDTAVWGFAVEPWGGGFCKDPITQKALDLAFVITGAEGKAKDIYDAESSRGESRIIVPIDKVIMSSFFYHLLEQFPILQKILSYIL